MNEKFAKWKVQIFRIAKWLRAQVDYKRIRESTIAAFPHVFAAALVGVLSVVYAKLFFLCEQVPRELFAEKPWVIFILAPVGFLAAWSLVARYAPFAGGSGIPQLMVAADLANEESRAGQIEEILGIKTFLIKIVSSCFCVLGGGAIGREGPTLQLAGSTFYFTHRVLKKTAARYIPVASLQSMIITGGAAGLAAAFNTPLGGIVYAIEELAKTHLSFFRTSLIQAVIVAGLGAQLMLGPYLYLGLPNVRPAEFASIPMAIVLSAGIGICGAWAGRFLFSLNTWRASRKSRRRQVLVTIGFGLLFACVTYFLGRTALGSGKDVITDLLFSDHRAEASWAVSRIFGNLLTYCAGVAGGIFAPALASGAALGSSLSIFLPSVDPHLVILLGMVSFLTGVTRTPFTSFVLVLEMTDRHSVIFSMMIGAMSANAAAYLVDEHSLYEKAKTLMMASLSPHI